MELVKTCASHPRTRSSNPYFRNTLFNIMSNIYDFEPTTFIQIINTKILLHPVRLTVASTRNTQQQICLLTRHCLINIISWYATEVVKSLRMAIFCFHVLFYVLPMQMERTTSKWKLMQ
mmetsp:Transcript_19306/g.27936  ORF Transcript_19306/g.27936 Transcript_19306/m.27936 type:complete len:119 (+) Transcript_19306:321-677(+)